MADYYDIDDIIAEEEVKHLNSNMPKFLILTFWNVIIRFFFFGLLTDCLGFVPKGGKWGWD